MRTYADMTFEEVMEAFADTVTRLAYLRMGNEQDAKDIFQNVFLKLYTQTMEFHDPQHVKAWLIQTNSGESIIYGSMKPLLRWRMYRSAMSCMS